ncbi:3-oxoacyl-ACP synthase [uncultured Algibacter sp.]|uniref:3-oxoacyl-ACP synthase n=1 Tax=uncultured Algibacter sp. TaxID=298659 RepID=UPI0025D26166|nr:3-oxoacyl-ACP synthase [uncultured Algibacter sp.]
MSIKLELYDFCLEFVDNRFQIIQNTIKEIQESLLSETKSSAGDKHETGRAMLQLEREKSGNQLVEIQKLKAILNKVNSEAKHQKIALGSVVYTTQSNYFIAISAGEIVLDSKRFYAISQDTPIAKLLISKTVGDEVLFRNTTIRITQIL